MKKQDISFRRLLITAIFSIFLVTLNAQVDSVINYPNLLLPRFTKSVVVLKSGQINTAVLNYNTIDQEMVFMQNGLFYVLDEPQKIDSIFMANRKFVPQEKGFYEVLYKGPVTLFMQHKSYAEFQGYPTGYGARSQTTSPNYVSRIYGAKGTLNLKIPNDYKVVEDSKYWLRYNSQMSSFENKKGFLKIFPEKAKDLNQYIEKNKINFKNTEDLKKLISYCNELFM